MNKDCPCQYCSNNINESFCITCGHNYNNCESIWQATEIQGDLPKIPYYLCPKCCHEEWKGELYPGYKLQKIEK